MILSTHAVVGAAIAELLPTHPVVAVTLAFASHFAFDAIPHWDYQIYSSSINPDVGGSLKLNKTLLFDMLRIGTDGVVGLLLSVVFFSGGPISGFGFWLPILCAGAAMFPDFLQFVYLRWRHEPIISLQRFHTWIHAKKRIYNTVLGFSLQIIFVVAIISSSILFAKGF